MTTSPAQDVDKPLVTVAIPVRNREATVRRAIESALAQTYASVEVIVSDNASTDATAERLRAFANDPRIVLLRQSVNVGMTQNFQVCLEHAKGNYFVLLPSDDYLEATALEQLIAPFLGTIAGIDPKDIALSWTPANIVDSLGNVMWTTEGGPAVEDGLTFIEGSFNGKRGVRYCGVFARTDDMRAVGGFSERYGVMSDLGNWGPLVLSRPSVTCTPEPLTNYTISSASETNLARGAEWQRICEVLMADLEAVLRQRGRESDLPRLRRARVGLISGNLAVVILQSIGQPGWIRYTLSEIWRAPNYLLSPRTVFRLFRESRKVLKLFSKSRTSPK